MCCEVRLGRFNRQEARLNSMAGESPTGAIYAGIYRASLKDREKIAYQAFMEKQQREKEVLERLSKLVNRKAPRRTRGVRPPYRLI